MAYEDYTNPAEAMSLWINYIAPKYFDFDANELHRTGVFGYINEVMAQTDIDSHHAVSIARREFYPTTAIYRKNLFKMAALHKIPYPLANAAICTGVLLLKEDELLQYATRVDGNTYNFVLDNSMVIMADDIPFMLDYPIVIVIKKTVANASLVGDSLDSYSNKPGCVKLSEDKVFYTVRYDTTYKNDLNTQTSKYIRNRNISYAGENMLLIKVGMRQCQMNVIEQSVSKSTTTTVVTMDFNFDGNLCNFEVFYIEGDNEPVQLEKLPLNSNPISREFCMYSMIDDNTLRLHFPDNAYFTPRFNSVIRVHIYTTVGEYGNFRVFNGSLACTPTSDTYQYNNMITVQGMCEGSSTGGVNVQNDEVFRSNIVYAYATNLVVTTESDLQSYFDNKALTTRNKILFFKRRDDVFERLYGAFMLLRDESNNVIPTNSLDVDIMYHEMDANNDNVMSSVIKAGRVWEYMDGAWSLWDCVNSTPAYVDGELAITGGNSFRIHPAYKFIEVTADNWEEIAQLVDAEGNPMTWRLSNGKIVTPNSNPYSTMYAANFIGSRLSYRDTNHLISLNEDINEAVEDMYYTNPFLIHINRAHNSVGYYLNTINDVKSMDLETVNDSSYIQFSVTSISVTRNAIRDENFYRLTAKLQPSIQDKDLMNSLIIPKEVLIENNDDGFPMQIFAESDGIVVGRKYIDGSVWLVVKYYCTNETSGNYTTYYHTDGMVDRTDDGDLIYIKISSSILRSSDDNFVADAWYTAKVDVGETFKGGDLIAERNCTDLLVFRAIAEIPNEAEDLYLPFVIEDYNADTDVYSICAYLATDDEMNSDDRLVITGGFYDAVSGELHHNPVSINPSGCELKLSLFLRYDDRYGSGHSGKYSYVRYHTLTNIYVTEEFNRIDFLTPMEFIRSTLTFSTTLADSNGEFLYDDYWMRVKEMPVVRSVWLKDIRNINYLVGMIKKNYSFIESSYDLLENNYTIDMKFYNTYGKSRFYRIGQKDNMDTMDRVNIAIYFGIQLNLLSDVSTFRTNFNTFVKDYIESFNDVTNEGKAIQIMDLVTAITNEFDEIARLEYYGIDGNNNSHLQNIESFTRDEIENNKELGSYMNYIPEFINIYMAYENQNNENVLTPQINITFLD